MIYIHVGLPKTATSSLQEILNQDCHSKIINFIGVNQPRGSDKDDELYFEIINYLNSQSCEELSERMEQTQQSLIKKHDESNLPLFISEEMITVDNLGISWQMKLERIASLFQPIPHKIIVTTREPISALHSFYTEIYHSVKDVNKDLFDFSINSNNALIYNYNELEKKLSSLFKPDDIVIYPFERLISDDGVNGLLDELKLENIKQKLAVTNTKKKKANGSYTRYQVFCEKILELNIGYRKKEILNDMFGKYEIPFSSKFIKKLQGDKLAIVKEQFSSKYY